MEHKPTILIAGMMGVHVMGKSSFYVHHIHQLMEKGEVIVINSEMGEEQLKKRIEGLAPREFLIKPTTQDDYIPLKPLLENKDFIGGGKKLPKKHKRR